MDNLAPVLSASHCLSPQKKGHSLHGALSVLTSWRKKKRSNGLGMPYISLISLYLYKESFWNVCFSLKIHCAIVLMTIHWHAVLRQSLMRKAIRWRQAIWRYFYRFITRSDSCNSTVAISPCTTPYTTWYMSVYVAPLTSAAQLIAAFQKKQVFHCCNGIFTSSSTPLSAVTMTALIASLTGLCYTFSW